MKYEQEARQILTAMDNSKVCVMWSKIDADELVEVIAREIDKIVKLKEVSER